MKYKIKVDIVNRICFLSGRLIEEQEKQYLEKTMFSEKEIKLGYQIIQLEEDIYNYITQTLEVIIDNGLEQYKVDHPNNIENLISIPPHTLFEMYNEYYEEIL